MEYLSDHPVENTDHAIKKIKWILIFAIILGLGELGVWSYKHQQHPLAQKQIAQAKTDLVSEISDEEAASWAPLQESLLG